MLRTVLVPLDGSQLAESVLPYARNIGKRSGATLVLLTAVHGSPPWGDRPVKTDTEEEIEAQGYLESRRREMEGEGLKVEIRLAHGPAAEEILAAAGHDVDLIAMSTHGRSGVTRWLFGSVAEKVLHAAVCPLLLVRAKEGGGEWRREGTIGRILVPLDGSPLSLSALPAIEELAKALGASLILFHAVPLLGLQAGAEMPPSTGEILDQLQAQAHQFLLKMVQEVKERGLKAESRVSLGFAADEIVRAADASAADLIAMGTHGRSGLGRWVIGSVALGVLHRTKLPCLLVRPPEAQKRA